LDHLQEALEALSRCVADPVRYRHFLEQNSEPSAPENFHSSLTSMSSDIPDTARNGHGD
jgi:hypothetical protein